MILYKSCIFTASIEEVEADRHNFKAVWINGNRIPKQPHREGWFNTYREAQEHLEDIHKQLVISAQGMLQRAVLELMQVEGLRITISSEQLDLHL